MAAAGVVTLGATSAYKVYKNGQALAKIATNGTEAIQVGTKLASEASELGFKTSVGTKLFVELKAIFDKIPVGAKPLRVHEGSDPSKIAIIGRGMGHPGQPGVMDAATILNQKGHLGRIFTPGKVAVFYAVNGARIRISEKNGIYRV